jgi:microcystin degradation protein MlrC
MEVNSFSQLRNKFEDFYFVTGKDMLRMTSAADVFLNEKDVEIIPSFYGNAVPSGVLEKAEFDKILAMLRDYAGSAGKIDGVWLYMHGAMEVENTGSGELRIVQELRSIIGSDALISAALDFHANNDPGLIEYCDIICGYKTAPHEDMALTQEKAAKLLTDCIRRKIRPITRAQASAETSSRRSRGITG